MFDLKKIWQLVAGNNLQDGHELPVSEGQLPGQTKKYTVGQLKQYIVNAVQDLIGDVAQGPQGATGATGAQGVAGPKGDKGDKGDPGAQGLKGDTGPAGPQGIAGPTGATGAQGAIGPQGIQGIQGEPGPQGPEGPQGTSGETIVAGGANLISGTVPPTSADGDDDDFYIDTVGRMLYGPKAGGEWPEGSIVLTGPTGPQGPQGVQGEQGIQGPAGADGAEGPQGPAGNDGAQGPQGEVGPQGNAGADGVDGDSAYISWLNLGNDGSEQDFIDSLKGEQGEPGPAGADGAEGPQGPAGEAGIQGPQGPAGPAIFEIGFACSDESTDLTSGVAKVTFRMPVGITISNIYAGLTTAATGSTVVVDINKNGTSILSTKLSIDATEKTSTTAATPYVLSDANLAADAEITIDIDQVGAVTAGRGLKVFITGTRI